LGVVHLPKKECEHQSFSDRVWEDHGVPGEQME